MRGSSKILMVLVATMILAAPLARAEEPLGLRLPTDETLKGTTIRLVRFDGVIYRVEEEVPCDLYFEKVDDELHCLSIKPKEGEWTPLCMVTVQWGMFTPIELVVEVGGTNRWLLNTETGYAEK